jgi:antitoxin component HigA of HigAB toxin-antitoxin module
MDRGAALTGEERKLLELLVMLIQAFENRVVKVEAPDDDDDEDGTTEAPLPRPHETLQRLMQSRGWDPEVLIDVFGNPHLVAEVMAGRRDISRGQAKALAKLFRMPVKLFLK